jgi:hypothetical protein
MIHPALSYIFAIEIKKKYTVEPEVEDKSKGKSNTSVAEKSLEGQILYVCDKMSTLYTFEDLNKNIAVAYSRSGKAISIPKTIVVANLPAKEDIAIIIDKTNLGDYEFTSRALNEEEITQLKRTSIGKYISIPSSSQRTKTTE